MPVGACWARAEVAAAFVPGDHGSTFGGQPLAMSAARATLAVMESEDVPSRARLSGARLRAGLERLPGVASVRGQGLLLAAVLTHDVAGPACAEALDAGLVVNAPRPDVLRLAPPCWCPRRRSTRPSASSPRSSARLVAALDADPIDRAASEAGMTGASPVDGHPTREDPARPGPRRPRPRRAGHRPGPGRAGAAPVG